MQPRVLVLGAGFGGLEFATLLTEELGDGVELTLIDRADAFWFGFSKLDLLFGRIAPDAVRMPYSALAGRGVRFVQETVTAIDPVARRVTTDRGAYDADHLLVALGADLDVAATPGLAEHGNEFYTVPGALRLRDRLEQFSGGRAVVGVCGTPYKCTPAPSECALLVHDFLVESGRRADCAITFVTPLDAPVPPSPDMSRALTAAFAERDIEFIPQAKIARLDGGNVLLEDGRALPYDLFLGVPKHRVPVAAQSLGRADDGYIPVSRDTLQTGFDNVYAVGDCTSVGTAKAGVFAEGQAGIAAAAVIAAIRGTAPPSGYDGRGSCYIEVGHGLVGRVDVDFYSGVKPPGRYIEPSAELATEKRDSASSRRARWFGDLTVAGGER